MATELSRRMPVLYVEPPHSALAYLRRWGSLRPRFHVVNERLITFTPLRLPKGMSSPWLSATERRVRAQLARAVRAIGAEPRALISAWPLVDPSGAFDDVTSIYWAQDDYEALSSYTGWSRRQVELKEGRIAASATHLVASSPAVQEAWRRRGYSPTLIPFGSPPQSSAPTPLPGDIQLPKPRVAFVGHINARIDTAILEELASRGHSLVFIGPRYTDDEPKALTGVLSLPNVQWLGPRSFDSLPGYLAQVDVGIVPYDTSDAFNRGSFPLKTLEYLAAGLPVVSTPLPSSLWLSTDLISIEEEPAAFADRVQEHLSGPTTPEMAEIRRRFAETHSWERRIDSWMPLIGSPPANA